MNGVGYGITPFMGASGILARSSGGGGVPFVNTYSMTFDGIADYIDLGTASNLEITDDFSISVWIKDSSALNRGIICCGDRSGTSGWMIYRNSSNKAVFSLYTVNNRTAISTTSINTGTWTNIIATFEKNGTANQQVKIYINGTLEGQSGWLSTQTPTYAGTIYKQIAFPYVGTNEFEGLIDEASIYNRLLTSQEISEISTIPIDLTPYSPLSWWRMGDGDSFSTNWTLIDNGSGGNDGTSVSMSEEARLPISPNSYSQNSFVFDGIGDYFNVANNTTIGRTQNISFSVWMKSNTTARQWIIGNPTSSNGGSALYVENTDILIFQLGDGTNDSYFNSRVSSLSTYAPTGQWNHILATFDGTDAKIFINGVLRNTWSPTTPYTISGWSNFYIGRRQANVSNMFNGYLDEVYIWDNDQSGNISTIYGNGVPTDISSLNPISHWRMGESATWDGANWTLTDQGSGGNDATSVSMPFEAKTGDQPYVL